MQISNNKKKRHSKFFFGHFKIRQGNVYLRKTFSNFIVTLTDLNHKVIYCCTSGAAAVSRSKKIRRSPYTVELLFSKILAYLKFHKIGQVNIILKMRVNTHVYFFFKEFTSFGITISRIFERHSLPHNGVRARKMPRK